MGEASVKVRISRSKANRVASRLLRSDEIIALNEGKREMEPRQRLLTLLRDSPNVVKRACGSIFSALAYDDGFANEANVVDGLGEVGDLRITPRLYIVGGQTLRDSREIFRWRWPISMKCRSARPVLQIEILYNVEAPLRRVGKR
ncbi:MAG: hypothetical protein U1E70_16020 [Acetobacteraceae bacterium]